MSKRYIALMPMACAYTNECCKPGQDVPDAILRPTEEWTTRVDELLKAGVIAEVSEDWTPDKPIPALAKGKEGAAAAPASSSGLATPAAPIAQSPKAAAQV